MKEYAHAYLSSERHPDGHVSWFTALQVIVSQDDVSSRIGARVAVAAAQALAPLAGVFHLAMQLEDAPLASQARIPYNLVPLLCPKQGTYPATYCLCHTKRAAA